jgi:hypothetical protein
MRMKTHNPAIDSVQIGPDSKMANQFMLSFFLKSLIPLPKTHLLQAWPNQRMHPTPLSRRIASGASRKVGLGQREASRSAAARVMRDRWVAFAPYWIKNEVFQTAEKCHE